MTPICMAWVTVLLVCTFFVDMVVGGFTGKNSLLECPYNVLGNNSIACPNIMNNTYGNGSPTKIVQDKLGYAEGFVMSHPIAIYCIWYGAWDDTDKNLIKTFLKSLTNPPTRDGSPTTEDTPSLYSWWQTVTQYSGPEGPASSVIRLYDRYHLDVEATSSHLTFSDIEAIIKFGVLTEEGGTRLLPGDPWGIYLFLPAQGIGIDGFCDQYCSIHSKMSDPKWKAAGLVYVVVGYPTGDCIDACSPFGLANPDLKPTHGQAIDSILNAMAHEIAECPVNNDQLGWGDFDGLQIADKCNFDFGSKTFTTASGGVANLHGMDGSAFFIQQLWSNKGASCVLQGS